MDKMKLTNENRKSIALVILIVFSYALERVIELFIPQGRTLGIVLAMVYTLLLAFTVFALYKSRDAYYGLLAGLFGYKMMPVSISFLYGVSHSASMLYFIVQRAGMLMFLMLIYRFYVMQDKKERVSAPTVLTIIFSVPFFNVISDSVAAYLLERTGSMLYGYFVRFAVYAFATFVILITAYCSGVYSLRFALLYEIPALVINILKSGAKIGYRVINNWHISKSFYAWIAVYAFLIVCFIVAMKIKTKKKC